MVTVYLGLGSNLGDREANINKALVELVRTGFTRLIRTSSLYETKPVGIKEQPDFLNAAAEIETKLSPKELMAAIREVERKTGREKTFKWGPRIIDIDILLYGDECITEESLEIPHPQMHQRAFVLTPLAEIAPKAKHPKLGLTVERLSAQVGNEGVGKY
ncbi:MAG: 2-amino-4-hydroxy-6-hydroxymethyldihydropteridine diphosphokinase [Candidatus Abyssobacteria bacterium SURF_17]|uniref:2-amino-4-hydroxy-6-hydroxymethyldihydropteridine pyrophosphokinase n=1 Tax=Candidatus Abyssobacteria bacterium SURF_17 TaxID=2093361 RepID=A0A419F7I1_9BACT|nr:MAG: 2-amino-4-hydroxy-6-hydroxymethyldihydropteridine diphosphokinase [Candidatus Abyssubacteria bacterium SURF_17]